MSLQVLELNFLKNTYVQTEWHMLVHSRSLFWQGVFSSFLEPRTIHFGHIWEVVFREGRRFLFAQK